MNGQDSGNECLSAVSVQANDCPAGGFRILYDWSNELEFANLKVGSNITTPNDRGDTRRISSVRTCAGPAYGRATGMSITSAKSNAIVGYWNFARNNFNGTAMEAAQPRLLSDPTQSLFSPESTLYAEPIFTTKPIYETKRRWCSQPLTPRPQRATSLNRCSITSAHSTQLIISS